MSSLSSRAALTLLLALSSVSRIAHAEATVQACSEAYTKGQEERLVGRLFSARSQFYICDDSACPEAIVADCKRWTGEVEAELPSISLKATTPSGELVENLSFTVDGTPIASEELARPIIVDVGPHVFRLEAPGFQPVQLEHELTLEDRELPIVSVMLPVPVAPPPPPPPPPPVRVIQPAAPPAVIKPFPVAALTLASVGTVALGGSLYFGLSARHQYHQLQAQCAPTCADADRQSVDHKAVLSDVALAASLVAFGAAAWLYFSDGAPHSNTAVGLEPRPDGARMRVRVTF